VLALALAATVATRAAEGQSPVSGAWVTKSVTATVAFAPRTSLRVSTQVLRFHVTDEAIAAEAVVEFAAGARTSKDGEVVLVVRTPAEIPGMTLMVGGGTTDAVSGTVANGDATVVARWIGGGSKNGQLQFLLRAAPGMYAIPVTFHLSAL
jgi:hypothetical protein